VPKQISGGIVNGKAILLPKPEYPATAVAAKAKGEVKVQVLIDETGNVVSAKSVTETAHPALRSAAEMAALQAKFSPTKLSGNPVKVSGVIVYIFDEPKQGYEEQMKPMALGLLLRISVQIAEHPESVKELFGGEDFFSEAVEDFPQFAVELKSLSKYQTMSPKQRIETGEQAFAGIKSKIAAPDKWQFEVGAALGDMIGVFGPFMNEKELDPAALDFPKMEARVRTELVKINGLIPQVPESFPKPLLEKLKPIAAESAKEQIMSEENLEPFFNKVLALIETISPSR